MSDIRNLCIPEDKMDAAALELMKIIPPEKIEEMFNAIIRDWLNRQFNNRDSHIHREIRNQVAAAAVKISNQIMEESKDEIAGGVRDIVKDTLTDTVVSAVNIKLTNVNSELQRSVSALMDNIYSID